MSDDVNGAPTALPALAELDLPKLRRRLVDREPVSLPWVPKDGMCAYILLDSETRAIVARLERAERVETAARTVAYEIERMESLSEVPQLGQIAWWRGELRAALEGKP